MCGSAPDTPTTNPGELDPVPQDIAVTICAFGFDRKGVLRIPKTLYYTIGDAGAFIVSP